MRSLMTRCAPSPRISTSSTACCGRRSRRSSGPASRWASRLPISRRSRRSMISISNFSRPRLAARARARHGALSRPSRKRPHLRRARRRENASRNALGRAAVEAGHSVLCTSATALLAALAKAETEGQLADRLLFIASRSCSSSMSSATCRLNGEAPSLLSAGRSALRARQPAHHHQSARHAVGRRLRR